MKNTAKGRKRAAGLILAAGASRRMGAPKQLLPLKGEPLVARVVREVLESDLDCVALVLGHEAQAVKRALGNLLRHPRLCTVLNPAYAEGISSSIRAGLERVGEACDLCMILLGDMPFVDRSLLNRFLRVFVNGDRPLGAVVVRGRRSHPVIFHRTLYPELLALRGDRGARDLFSRYRDRALFFDAEYDDRDIDTPAEYASLTDETDG